ncbi:MAG TPA: amidohydrolase family protein [Blastocatellia bacterium]|jgi:imidazolonepropionase-like amidohydrolase|nr:amidohydrolase family protein [Blastocatellia bacterium]
MKNIRTQFLAVILAGAFVLAIVSSSSPAVAQSPETYAIRNARIVPVTGPVIENGTVVIAAGKIAAVGPNVSVPSGAKIINGSGLSVYPGMIDAGTVLGLSEISSVAGTVDTSEIGDNNANIRADIAVKPDSSHIAVTRVNGITTVLTAPQGGLIAGQGALINLDGWTPKEMLLKPQVSMHINWPGGGGGRRGGFGGFQGQRRSVTEARREQDRQIASLKKMLRDAKAYADAKDARAKDPSVPRRDIDLRMEGLIPVVRGQMPLVVEADSERDIKAAIAFADEMKVNLILSGAAEAWRVADQLKAKNIPVVVGQVLQLPSREDDAYDQPFTNAAILQKAGVKIAFKTQDSAHVRDLPYNAGQAAAFGLPKEEALKAVTIYPAEIFGVSNLVGSIEKGKVANVIVTDGDPLEILTQVKFLFINGRQVDLNSRHTELYEKYKARP